MSKCMVDPCRAKQTQTYTLTADHGRRTLVFLKVCQHHGDQLMKIPLTEGLLDDGYAMELKPIEEGGK